MSQLLRTKSIDALIAASEEPEQRLKKTLGVWSLIALGIGAVIGSGIFTVTGTAAAGRAFLSQVDPQSAGARSAAERRQRGYAERPRWAPGPAISLSFVLVAIACGFAAHLLRRAGLHDPHRRQRLHLRLRDAGRNLRLDHRLGPDPRIRLLQHERGGRVSRPTSTTCSTTCSASICPSSCRSPSSKRASGPGHGSICRAFIVLLILSYVLVRGVRESAQTNNVMVVIKIVAILLFVFGAAHAVNTANWHPFMPQRILGRADRRARSSSSPTSASIRSRRRRRNAGSPQRDMPIGIFATLAICALLYGSVSLVLTGIANWSTLNNDAPVANALKMIGMNRLRLIVTAGALLGMLSSLLVFQYGQARIWFAMSRDRLLPDVFSRVHPQVPDAAHQHLGGGVRGGHSGRHFRRQLVRRSVEHRDAVRLHPGFGGCDRAAQEAAGAAARVPGAAGPAAAGDFDRLLPGADAEPAAGDLDALFRLADHRASDLFQL